MTFHDYFIAGYNLAESHRPPYSSSPIGMAFMCGEWCRQNNITPHEIKASRGYTWIINRTYKLNFNPGGKWAPNNPSVTNV
jgi:hypothetical protein